MLKILTLTSRAPFSAAYLAQLQKLHNERKFHEMLGLKSQPLISSTLSKNDLRRTYLELIKKYHSDKCHDNPDLHKQYEEISKLIISAYYNIEKMYFPEDKYKNEYETEDQICKALFGKTYNESKYEMYKPGNEGMRQKFLEELARRTGQTYKKTENNGFKPKPAPRPTSSSTSNEGPREQKSSGAAIGIGAIAIIALGALFFNRSKPEPVKPQSKLPELKKEDYEKKIQQINAQRAAKTKEKADAMIKLLLKDQPPCLKYPDEEPHLFTQLTEYSIAPDIHLYEVPGDWYEPEFIEEVNKNPEIIKEKDIYRINRIKPNTVMTLSLQAERALHNIYVRVKDVIKEIEDKGNYTPPKVFTRFHGYIMFELRDKPISLKNYKDTEYVSLFDLYFDYYSPMFLKKDQFCQYLVGKDQPELFGWVYLNHRKCQPQYIKKGEKYVFFISNRLPDWEEVNRKIWNGYYQKYEDRWLPGGNTKARVGI